MTTAEHTLPEPHTSDVGSRLNWLRAGVLGANDGIVSTAGLVIGVAAAGASTSELAAAGVAALAAGAVSMALGEYVSVSAQRDTEQVLVQKERWELSNMPDAEHQELVGILRGKGLSEETAERAATEMAEHDALGAHLDLELGMDPDELTNPWVAALSSAVSFMIGAVLPLIAVLLAPQGHRVWVTVVSTLLALTITGTISARFSQARRGRSIARLVIGGGVALAVTYLVGALFDVQAG